MDKNADGLPPSPSQEEQLHALLAALEAAVRGDFSRLPIQGTSPLVDRLVETFNSLMDRLSTSTAEVSRVAREVGTEGKLGGQADARGASGAWRELTEAVNALARSHTTHVRDLARVASAVARGELSEKVTGDVRGEALELKNTVNTMVDQLSAFAAEVNRVAKEVGPEGKRGRPSGLQNVSGIWKDLNDNVGITERLAASARFKSESLANMSHELRTPLNSVIILSEVLAVNKEGHLSSKEVEYARTIHRSGTDLLHLISSLLDMSKGDAGRMQVDLSLVPLEEVTEFCSLLFQYQAERKGVGFSVHRGEDLPTHLYTDRLRLQQVLKNLLSNAFKFTEKGRVELRIRRMESQPQRFSHEALLEASHVLAFSVVDSGIGIPQEKQARIFEPFLQADDSTSRQYGGTGLGLTISRSLADLLGGELHVDSEPGRGSTFTLYLPERPPLPGSVASHSAGPAPEPGGAAPGQRTPARGTSVPDEPDPLLAGRKVLVVGADIRVIFAVSGVLERRKIQVLIPEGGQEDLELLRAHPDAAAVLLDVAEAELGSYETVRAIRQDPRLASMPLIALIPAEPKGGLEKCLEAGANDFVTKPMQVDVLFARLHRRCRASEPAEKP